MAGATALLFGLAGGGAIATAAGARRTETAYTRFLEATRAFDVIFTNGGTTPTNANRQFDFDEVARLPGVAEAARARYYSVEGRTASGRAVSNQALTPLAPADTKFGRTVNEYRVLEGRLPRADDEIALTLLAQEGLDVGVGETLRLSLSGLGQVPGPPQPVRIVGVVAAQAGFPPLTGGLPPPAALAPGYAQRHPGGVEVIAVRLENGRDGTTPFERTLERLAGGEQVAIATANELTSVVQRGLDVQATTLRLLALAVGLTAVLLLAQGLARQGSGTAGDYSVLHALGLGPSQLRALPSARAAALGAVASATAALTAVALSPLTPVGVARKAEVRPGLELNAAHVGVGVASIAFIVVALGVLTSWRSATAGALADADEVTHGSPSRVANALARPRLPVSATVGVRMAVQPGRGRATVPVRSTLVGASIGVATIVAVITFAASLGHLFDEPRLYGWNWDLQIGDQFAPDLTSTAADLRRHPDVTRVTSGTQARLTVGSLAVDALALDQPGIEPVVVAGRPARAADEILLGTRTLRALGLDIGDRVPVAFGDRSATMRVVGRGVLPEFAGSARLGEGAVLTFAGIERLVPEAERDVMLLRLRPDTDVGAFLDETGVVTEQVNPYLPDKPSDLADLERVGGLPSVVVGLLALMAAATVAHTLTTSVRRRRRDLAILKVLGLGRRQVSAVVAWQSTVIAVVAVVAGVPLGAAAGRWAWRLFADQLGVPPEAVTPLAAVLLLVPGTILLANLVGAVPAWLAGRTRPAVVLRTG